MQKKQRGKAGPIIVKAECSRCLSLEPLIQVSFSKNTGMIVLSTHTTIKGFFCRRCLRSLFKEYQIHNLALGWWGLTSFFIINPIYLILNTWRYYFAIRNLKKNTLL
jgi:hypothetical protein